MYRAFLKGGVVEILEIGCPSPLPVLHWRELWASLWILWAQWSWRDGRYRRCYCRRRRLVRLSSCTNRIPRSEHPSTCIILYPERRHRRTWERVVSVRVPSPVWPLIASHPVCVRVPVCVRGSRAYARACACLCVSVPVYARLSTLIRCPERCASSDRKIVRVMMWGQREVCE